MKRSLWNFGEVTGEECVCLGVNFRVRTPRFFKSSTVVMISMCFQEWGEVLEWGAHFDCVGRGVLQEDMKGSIP